MNYAEKQFYYLYSTIQKDFYKEASDVLRDLYIKTIKFSILEFSEDYDF